MKFGSFQGFIVQILCCEVAVSQKATERKEENVFGLMALDLHSCLPQLRVSRKGQSSENPGHSRPLPPSSSSKALEAKCAFPEVADVLLIGAVFPQK